MWEDEEISSKRKENKTHKILYVINKIKKARKGKDLKHLSKR